MFFGGVNGFNAFFPEQIVDNLYPPPVVITVLSIFNEVVNTNLLPNERIEVTHGENFLSFDFATLDYNNPKKNQYAYMMEGVDEDWVYIGNRRHTDYPDLRPGDYTFRVIGSNNDGVWNEVGASVAITIRPPIWQTSWFISLLLVALVGAGYGAYRLRVRSLEQRGRELEAEVAARTSELRETNLQLEQAMLERERAEQALAQKAAEAAVIEERNRLARDLHDSVTQSIYSSTLLAEAGQRLASKGENERLRNTFQRLGQITQQALKEMRLLVYELRPPLLDEVGLVGALQGRLDAVERRAGVDARLIVGDDFLAQPTCEAALFFIAQEALNNALKHAAPSKVEVHLDIVGEGDQQACRLIVCDDGLGFEIEEVEGKGGLGLVSMRERVEVLGGMFELSSSPGMGTEIRVTIPDARKVHQWEG
jgi:signal transduction histidine kinase